MTMRHGLPVTFLKPGDLLFAERPTVVSTVLGSCVAVTLFSRHHRLGAICHAQLPTLREGADAGERGGRFVDSSIRLLLEGLRARGVGRKEVVAKLFGGCDMFTPGEAGGIGKKNVEKALQVLEAESVTVVASDLGGTKGRKIFFYTHTGEVFLKHLGRVEQ